MSRVQVNIHDRDLAQLIFKIAGEHDYLVYHKDILGNTLLQWPWFMIDTEVGDLRVSIDAFIAVTEVDVQKFIGWIKDRKPLGVKIDKYQVFPRYDGVKFGDFFIPKKDIKKIYDYLFPESS